MVAVRRNSVISRESRRNRFILFILTVSSGKKLLSLDVFRFIRSCHTPGRKMNRLP